MIRTLFVRTMHDSQWTDPTRVCAFVGQMVGRSALEVGMIAGADLMNGGWKRHLAAAFPSKNDQKREVVSCATDAHQTTTAMSIGEQLYTMVARGEAPWRGLAQVERDDWEGYATALTSDEARAAFADGFDVRGMNGEREPEAGMDAEAWLMGHDAKAALLELAQANAADPHGPPFGPLY